MQTNSRVGVVGQVEENVQELVTLIDTVLDEIDESVHAEVVALFILAKSGQQSQTVLSQVRDRANDLGEETRDKNLPCQFLRSIGQFKEWLDLQVLALLKTVQDCVQRFVIVGLMSHQFVFKRHVLSFVMLRQLGSLLLAHFAELDLQGVQADLGLFDVKVDLENPHQTKIDPLSGVLEDIVGQI